MNEVFVSDYIRQRMQEMGYGKFHIKPVRIAVSANLVREIPAYNEFYFLESATLSDGTIITADNDFLIAQGFTNMGSARFKEFTGNISIESNENQHIEFLRVIPL